MHTAHLNTPLGTLQITGNAQGVASVVFVEVEVEVETPVVSAHIENAKQQLSEYFKGNRKNFQLKLNPQGTPFQKKVWEKLKKIPFGKTVSYLHIAHALGNPKVIRAAAAANGKNPISIIIPCHRVVGSDGSLTGYASGLHRKKWLLAHENPVKQGALF
ncbi:MAG: methylated-DNA--[protein]-cysteine S-methyltransferase [Marinirhabdus sp.]